jgi:hypothetical protein
VDLVDVEFPIVVASQIDIMFDFWSLGRLVPKVRGIGTMAHDSHDDP